MNSKIKNLKIALITVIIITPLTMMSFSVPNEKVDGPAFSLSNEKSTLNWKGTKPGGSHYGVIDVVEGSLETDGSALTGGSFTIDMNSIICHDLTNENYNKKLVGHLASEDFFYAEKYPKAYFEITSVEKQMSTEVGFSANHMITGDLTIRGTTNEVSFPAYVTMDEKMVYAKTAEITLDRTKWNVNYQSKKVFANLADKYIDDDMIVSLDLRFDKK